ncbi:MAG: TraR/DksA C4-type zinc finger protein [Nitrospirae bacterium]|nr:TraR/DksA C4-type zinc finger protein [Nitrospirota bacterium]
MKRYEDVIGFHGHSCPGLALGYRVALRALKELGERSEDEELVAVVENNSCAVDAVQVMTGCTFGKGNLIFRDYGKQVYTFIRRPSGKSVRIAINWEKPEEAPEEKKIWARYMKGDRSKKLVEFVHDRKAAKTRHILEADEKDLLRVTRGTEMLPPQAEIYQSITCEACGEKVMEPRARIMKGKVICLPCFERKA